MNIRAKDLNLLHVFVGIAEELNLSRVSGRLGLSQPALSHALARLRVEFEDPLFVRSQRGLVATPRVAVLLPQIRAVLGAAERLYGSAEELDLSKLERQVVIASTTYFEARVMPGFIRQASKEAPLVRIETRSLDGGVPKVELESGEYDLAIAAYFERAPTGCHMQTIYEEGFVCICGKKHPYLKSRRGLTDYLEQRHLQIEVPPGVVAPIDLYLQSKRKRRDIALRVGNFLTPPAILVESPLLLTCPLSLAEQYRRSHALVITELPCALPSIHTRMVWHEKNHRDVFHGWLRESMIKGYRP